MTNILFLGGGRRFELAQRFIDRGYDLFFYELTYKVPVADISPVFEGYSWGDIRIFEDVENIIYTHNIDLVIPLQDEAAIFCGALKTSNPELSNKIMSGDFYSTMACFDKEIFQFIFEDEKYYPVPDNKHKVIIKPVNGFGSKGITVANSVSTYNSMDNKKDFVAQRKIEGSEYTVDCYYNLDGKLEDACVRKRLRVSGGEVLSSITCKYPKLVEICRLIGEKLENLHGPVNIQFIVEDDIPYVIEANARFGGGYTLSMEAGLDVISLIERDYLQSGLPYEVIAKEPLLLERSFRDSFFIVEE